MRRIVMVGDVGTTWSIELTRVAGAEQVSVALPTAIAASDLGFAKIVVDAMNSREDLSDRRSSEIVTEELRGARVVKAFNQLPAAVLGRDPSENGGRRVVFVSSNDEEASSTVQALAKDLGFSPIGLGRLDEGGRLLLFRAPLVLHNLVEHTLS